MNKAVLFDLDGVLSLPEEVFSVIYTRSRGYDLVPFTDFFETEWRDFVTGKRDLKEHISDHPDFWKWDRSPEELLQFWFEAEDIKNDELIDVVRKLRHEGVLCYIATEQEKYRSEYIKNVMFKNEFDGYFSTAEIGYRKNDTRFYQKVLEVLSIRPDDLIFFDDSQSKVATAKSLGIDAHIYENAGQVKTALGVN